MYCGNCGTDVGQSNYCPHCGAQVQKQSMVQEADYKEEKTEVENFDLISAYKSMLKKYARFDGRSRRSEYWYATLANSIIYFCISFGMTIMLSFMEESEVFEVLYVFLLILMVVYGIAVLVPGLALAVRRLHDTGKSGWMLLLALIPYVGSIILIVFCALDSQPGENKYGLNPKGQ